jgi:hypothetical protein
MPPRRRIPVNIERRVYERARNRCGYCLSPKYLVLGGLQIEHTIPLAKGGSNDEDNLWLACPPCNWHKSDKIEAVDPVTGLVVPLFHPAKQVWEKHFSWMPDGVRIIGATAIGRATVSALHLSDDQDALAVRRWWVRAGWYPPRD